MNQKTESMLSVLLADIPGSARLHERIGADEARWAIDRCLNRAGRCVEALGGRVVCTVGHEMTAVFDTPGPALQAAIEMQQRIDDLPPVSGLKLAIRVGWAHGPVSINDDGIAGEATKIAAWLAGIAEPGQILTSAHSLPLLPPPLRDCFNDLGPVAHTGKMAGTHIYEYGKTSAPISPLRPAPANAEVLPTLRLEHAGAEVPVDATQELLTLGREASCDLVINGHKVSRLHATIERHDRRFVLTDQSTNGTFIKIGKEPEVRIHRKDFVLRGKGLIGFASSTHDPDTDLLGFEIIENSAPVSRKA